MTSTTDNPQFSIILTVNENSIGSLARNLPALINQRYESSFEVIVVNESNEQEVKEMLDLLKSTYPLLYTTFIPQDSHYLSRRKLALTLGVKAAKYEWIIFTEANCRPASDLWLETLARYVGDDKDMVCGYTNYDENSSPYQRYERMRQWKYQCLKVEKKMAYAYNGCNLAVRRSLFIEKNGFLSNLRYLRGEYDFMVNEFAQPYRTTFFYDYEGMMIQESPTPAEWSKIHIYYQETRRHLHRSWGYGIKPLFDMLALYLTYGLLVAAIILACIMQYWIIVGVAVCGLLSLLYYRISKVSRTAKKYHEHFPYWCIPFMELRVMWQNLYFIVKYMFTDQYEFIRR